MGLTRDAFSPWVIQFVTRLATRMSFASSRLLCRSVLGWSPSVELVLGLGRLAQPFAKQQPAPSKDGEVLVIEAQPMPAYAPPVTERTAEPTASAPSLWSRLRSRVASARAVVAAKCSTAITTVTTAARMLNTIVPIKRVVQAGAWVRKYARALGMA